MRIRSLAAAWRKYSFGEKAKGDFRYLGTCAFSPDGCRILSTSWNYELRIWDAASGKKLAEPAGHPHSIEDCAFSPNGSRMMSSSLDGTLRLWDADTGNESATLVRSGGRFSNNSFLPDGSAAQQQLPKQLELSNSSFSPDGGRILSTFTSGWLVLWDVTTEAIALEFFLGANIYSWATAWGPNGGHLAAGSEDGRLYMFKLENFSYDPMPVTAWREKGVPTPPPEQRDAIHIGCPLCRTWSAVGDPTLGEELDCPRCRGRLKLNPFLIDADWRPIASAWRAEPRDET
jgi:hypothetical protein